jgi:carbon-monoxide dehydrogenase medium subunit
MFDQVEVYHRPRSIREAVRLLRAGGRRARLVAGGTDVAVGADPGIRSLVDITRLGLSYIRRDGDAWAIGATTTMAEIERSSPILRLGGGILAKAAATCGSVQIRNMATVGGNLANASPAADTAVALLALDATVVVAGERTQRRIPLTSFFSGPHKTSLNGGLLVEIRIPISAGGRTGWSFQKLGRTESDISLVNVAAGFQVDARGRCKWARIALGAVAPTPLRAVGAEGLMAGVSINEETLQPVLDEVTREVNPVADIRASAEYRREMARVLTERALRECAAQAGCAL